MRSRVRSIVVTAVFSVFALVLSYIESVIPVNAAIPGFKLGLSNVVVAYVVTVAPFSAFAVLLLKVSLSVLLFGTPVSFIFSLCGGILSFAFMLIFHRCFKEKVSYLGIGALGAFFHNIGQLIVTAVIYGSNVALAYSTPMLISGIVCGALLGMILNLFSERIGKIVEKMY